ncbi:SGNH/GDSL hydrolase family protein [Amycolatopsis roodepoortensis]|uniref:Lysophospholipase L1-like esterase n=1 Tax=Amycolatopsis roodepoortensis TaxID=700274 RepID=A0ABR9LBC3_9PSEU|nr:SGNH/GDSL hydrolase family protein [Amycolatopsis roodepoortensis]MBE1577468.1 lysophospholipase L1-like esterase [Amycolatopsis roodepoortensis]
MFKRMSVAVLAAVTLGLLVTPPGHAAGAARYVAMGSSFAAGPGIPPQQPGTPAACGRSTKNYATLVAAERGFALTDVTCSGATTANILTSGQAGQPPQIEAVTRDTRLVTVTIGGNDVGYVGSLFTYGCQNTGGTNCGQVDQNAVRTALTTVHEKIGAVIAEVHRRAPRARVLVVDYLTIVPRTAPACDGVPLTPEQLVFEREVADRLATATRRAARAERATLVPAAAISSDHDACAAVPWMERYAAAPGRVPYHPNEAGMAAVADLVTERLRA